MTVDPGRRSSSTVSASTPDRRPRPFRPSRCRPPHGRRTTGNSRCPARTPSASLVVPESTNVGWVATAPDGTELTPIVVNGWQQGWILPAGTEGTVTLDFPTDHWYRLGIFGGLLLLIPLFAAALWPRRARERDPGPAPRTWGSATVGVAGNPRCRHRDRWSRRRGDDGRGDATGRHPRRLAEPRTTARVLVGVAGAARCSASRCCPPGRGVHPAGTWGTRCGSVPGAAGARRRRAGGAAARRGRALLARALPALDGAARRFLHQRVTRRRDREGQHGVRNRMKTKWPLNGTSPKTGKTIDSTARCQMKMP